MQMIQADYELARFYGRFGVAWLLEKLDTENNTPPDWAGAVLGRRAALKHALAAKGVIVP